MSSAASQSGHISEFPVLLSARKAMRMMRAIAPLLANAIEATKGLRAFEIASVNMPSSSRLTVYEETLCGEINHNRIQVAISLAQSLVFRNRRFIVAIIGAPSLWLMYGDAPRTPSRYTRRVMR